MQLSPEHLKMSKAQANDYSKRLMDHAIRKELTERSNRMTFSELLSEAEFYRVGIEMSVRRLQDPQCSRQVVGWTLMNKIWRLQIMEEIIEGRVEELEALEEQRERELSEGEN